MTQSTLDPQVHSPAWVFQSWASFAIAIVVTGIGIVYVPAEAWRSRGFLAMGLLFTIGATLNLAKTTRDVHESPTDVRACRRGTRREAPRRSPSTQVTGAGESRP